MRFLIFLKLKTFFVPSVFFFLPLKYFKKWLLNFLSALITTVGQDGSEKSSLKQCKQLLIKQQFSRKSGINIAFWCSKANMEICILLVNVVLGRNRKKKGWKSNAYKKVAQKFDKLI